MKLETLQQLFTRQSSVKLFVVSDAFCLCGHASRPRVTDAGMLVDIGASLRFTFGTRELIDEPETSGTLLLDARCRLTRRLQTHCRHLRGHDVPDGYLARARLL